MPGAHIVWLNERKLIQDGMQSMGGLCLKKRDWGAIGNMLKEEAGRFLRTAKKVVGEGKEPWIWKPQEDPEHPGADRPPKYQARQMVVLCLFKIHANKSFRWVDGFVSHDDSLCRELGFVEKCPSHETIRRMMSSLDESYLRDLNWRVLAELEKTSAEGKR